MNHEITELITKQIIANITKEVSDELSFYNTELDTKLRQFINRPNTQSTKGLIINVITEAKKIESSNSVYKSIITMIVDNCTDKHNYIGQSFADDCPSPRWLVAMQNKFCINI